MHQVRGHGNWQNGAVMYKVIDGKNLKITATGTRLVETPKLGES